ncbi:glycosyltransferase family 39 protein [Nostoc sp. FACHB-145]|uniref:glycosyltransferase family 39 protein n=1 Tax=Nostoc sp. FACHB-145 TaxID=2692836 RepID=UPI0016872CDE|nr:glycosyltransferase family 39 protein [Nostoc sp. FACHB-145]MBD2472395.1 glycosyltransferase family 39 protein [Nostoc sp. FACHB-145]
MMFPARKTKSFVQIFKLITITLLLLGIFLRFANIEQKIFWTDETFTRLRISGHTKSELKEEVFKSQILSPEELLNKYQLPVPEKNYLNIIRGLALEDPKHPPLYFIIARFWIDIFGNTVAAIRSLSAVFSLLVFPCLYWLCLELFQSSSVGLVALATISISPFHILYAQEARMYSLYTLIILLSSATLLRAMRINSKLSWCLYAVSLSLGFYTHSLFTLVAIGQGAYLFLIKGFRLNKTVYHYIVATLLGTLTFIPWGFFIVTQLENVEKTIAWAKKFTPPLSDLLDTWQINLARIFLDITPNYKFSDKLQNDIWFLFIRFICIIFLYGLYFICRKTSKKVWLFILILILITSAFLAIPDVFLGGIQSTITRYLTPVFLGFHLALTYLFAQKALLNSQSLFKQKIWRLIFILFLLMELFSCYVIFPSKTWNKAYNSDNIPIVNIIHQSKNPILICSECIGDGGWGNILSISYLLKPTVKIQMFPGINISQDFNDFSDVFFLRASEKFRNYLKTEQNLEMELVYKNKLSLWKLEQK